MKSFSTIVMAIALLTWASVGNANITTLCGGDDGDTALDCTGTASGIGTNSATLTLPGTQYWAPANAVGSIDTSDALDPTITYINSVENDTDFTWTGYHINYSLDASPSAITGNLMIGSPTVPSDWTGTVTEDITPDGSGPYPARMHYYYVGQIDYTNGGTLVNPGDTLDFTYKLVVGGATHYSYTQEMIPVPKPCTLILVLGGILGLVALRRIWA